MNISKQMLRIGVAIAVMAIGGRALADGVTPISLDGLDGVYNESFETPTNNAPYTDMGAAWDSSSEDDISSIVELEYTLAAGVEGVTYPLPAAAHSKVLKLNTEGGTLSANFDGDDASFATDPIYIDSVVNFVVSEDDPSFTGMDDLKIAVFANANSNLVVRHGMFDESFTGGFGITNSVTSYKIDPEKWYRLTITMKFEEVNFEDTSLFNIVINGDPSSGVLTHENAIGGGKWFASAVQEGAIAALTAISFQGTGYIDDLVATRNDPFDGGNQGFYNVYVVVNPNGSATVDNIAVESPVEVAANGNLTITFTADQWYRIAAVTVDSEPDIDAADKASYELELTNVSKDINVEATFAAATAAQVELPDGVPASWAAGFYDTEAAAKADANLADDYMLGLDPTNSYEIALSIGSIEVAGGNVTVTCLLTDNGAPLKTTINGFLTVYGKKDLADAEWSVINTTIVSGAKFVDGEYTVEAFEADDYNFFKAIISLKSPPSPF